MQLNLPDLKRESSGAIGDLGTFLPYVIGAIAVAGLDATGVLFCFGLFYIFTGFFYKVPVPVQPMKVIGAAILVHGLTAGEIAWAGILMGICLLFLAFTGLVDKLAHLTPISITAGIQAGLGISLAMLGTRFISNEPLLGIAILVIMFLLLGNEKIPASIIAVIGGTIAALIIYPDFSISGIKWGIYLPHPVLPEADDFYRGFTLGFLPQLPLTLTNSVLVTAALAQELYGERSKKVTERNLCFTLGFANLISVPLGGYVMCHGSGGMAAHHRFGGQTGYTPAIMGIVLLFIALFLGSSSTIILKAIPDAVLGTLLFFSGIDLVTTVKGIKGKNNVYVFIIVVVLSIAINPAVAFLAGIPVAYLLHKNIVKL